MNNPVDTQGNIVIVDDQPNNLRVLSGILQQVGYKVRPALDGAVALKSIKSSPPDLILLDIRMPEMDGYEVCRQLKRDEQTRDIPVIFISALQDMEDKLAAFQAGGVDYVSKPFQMEEVLARVQAHLKLYRLQRDLQDIVDERTLDLRTALESLKESQKKYAGVLEETILAISMTIEKRDPYTAGHQWRVSQMAVAIATELGMDAAPLEGLRLGAMVHDIGKIYVPVDILTRPGRLSDIEFSLIKVHPQVGSDIMRQVHFPWPVADMILQHHERLDGSGYPNGLKGEEILFEARVIAVADVLEAMASHRPYRPGLGQEPALAEIRRGAGSIYDADVAAACLRLFEEKGYSMPKSNF
ncbi:response regulator [Methylomonas montana]|uniref:HD domain-containing phosphohydrolase n=1 Tax=Methylomonas montana TaxID=3058963 RepID=UPI0026592FF3|nr:HD domain-containing phosphohydrolase [Methylomonas montana]WKJ88679.1 response regulator [Methylomonas montana]